MSLGFSVQPCAYCNTLTAIRYKTMYACLDHIADAQRDDPQAIGRKRPAELAARLAPPAAQPATPVRQVSLPIKAHYPEPSAFERLGPQMMRPSTLDALKATEVRQTTLVAEFPNGQRVPFDANIEVEVEIDGRTLTSDEVRDEFLDPDPLHLEGFNPATKTYDTPSGVYEGMPEQLSAPAFVECDTCRAKPGAPLLCADCLRRRDGVPDLPIVDVPDDWE